MSDETKPDEQLMLAELTARDFFAALTLAGFSSEVSDDGFKNAARWCYKMADAMIEERSKAKGEPK